MFPKIKLIKIENKIKFCFLILFEQNLFDVETKSTSALPSNVKL